MIGHIAAREPDTVTGPADRMNPVAGLRADLDPDSPVCQRTQQEHIALERDDDTFGEHCRERSRAPGALRRKLDRLATAQEGVVVDLAPAAEEDLDDRPTVRAGPGRRHRPVLSKPARLRSARSPLRSRCPRWEARAGR